MRWRTGRESDNVEDRRGLRAAPTIAGGGIGTIILVLVAMYFGIDPSFLLQSGAPGGTPAQQPVSVSPGQDDPSRFVSVVLADTEDTWHGLFRQMGGTYREPKLVLFSGAVQSACGFAQAAVGPFYCPADQKVYIDLGFYQELKNRFQAPGDFAQAYVIAHEIGHHVQNLLGISDKVESLRARSGTAEANALSVRLELQADCFAGVWAYHAHKARQILESGDVEEGLNAASAIGDDRLQMQARGYVAPDSFTHGSSAQRVRWFKRGIAGGDLRQCDTFSTAQL
ncbi:MAG TPA: flagellar biosynthesis protein FlgM [Xanthomonadaceae bacterium]|nr:flagellar biosynthesis protein FlgM [Xanthomonadaceae bacterium]